jgi:hypothetical protein
MKNKIWVLYLMTTLLLISGCQSSPAQLENKLVCKDPRPEICTMNYQPVCGLDSSNSAKTYSNACGACSDKNVVTYMEGECSE